MPYSMIQSRNNTGDISTRYTSQQSATATADSAHRRRPAPKVPPGNCWWPAGRRLCHLGTGLIVDGTRKADGGVCETGRAETDADDDGDENAEQTGAAQRTAPTVISGTHHATQADTGGREEMRREQERTEMNERRKGYETRTPALSPTVAEGRRKSKCVSLVGFPPLPTLPAIGH